MRIAIIGGGSAGLVCAHLLDSVHDVVVFERQPMLGGHVRTLNGNVPSELDPSLRLDAGVIEFEVRNFPRLMRLFDKLGCETRPVAGTTTFWTRDGEHHLSPGSIRRAQDPWPKRLGQLIDLIGLRMQGLAFDRRTALPDDVLESLPLSECLTDADMDRWAALLTMYAYSIPYERVPDMPAALTVPMLRAFERAESWVSLKGGAWCYLHRIVESLRGEVRLNQVITGVTRDADGVTLNMLGPDVERFDKVVFAAPPDQTLKLLTDPSEAELRRFGGWKPNHIQTLVHCDSGMYERRGIQVATEFDVYELSGGQGGYNSYLNDLCGVADSETRYGLAFGMEDEIDPAKVLHRQKHHTPDYTVDAYRWHVEVSATNGENHTFHAGAWLGNGLQEGAVVSAEAVSRLLGGDSLDEP
ncbi:MAG: FAD-dependent oxidoreductase [Proteobacteria bacterium]|nr:FAD-dependent oxidoreductase [Pseudomonadota bacterium]